jgi:hypothetical protein
MTSAIPDVLRELLRLAGRDGMPVRVMLVLSECGTSPLAKVYSW